MDKQNACSELEIGGEGEREGENVGKGHLSGRGGRKIIWDGVRVFVLIISMYGIIKE